MTFAISISKIFFQKKFYAWNCLIRKDHRLFFRFAKIFWFFVVAPHQQIFEISEEVQFLQGHEELNIGNGTVIFSERPSSQKLTIFWIWPNLKLSIFNQQPIWPNLLYLGNPEDSCNGVGDFFRH